MSQMLSQSTPPIQDLRGYLQHELAKRTSENPSYSLRAFARSLDLDSSLLCKVLNGKRNVGNRFFEKAVRRLGLPPSQVALISQGRSTSRQWAKAPESDRNFKALDKENFDPIRDWYHYAIYELMLVKNFRARPAWIAASLGISETQAASALRRLERAGVIVKSRRGWTRSSQGITNLGKDNSAASFRELQRQLLEKSLEALEQYPIDRRDHSSMTMAIDARQLPQAKEIIRKFRRDLSEFLQKSSKATEVYQLNIAFFPLSECEKGSQPCDIS